MSSIFARSALIATGRLLENVKNNPAFRVQELRDALKDIESRLRDELGLVRLFALNDQESFALLPGHVLVGQVVADRFPSLSFEMNEAAKCQVLSRSTACAFHSMRATEVAVRALARFLNIPDPLKPAERNWRFVLSAIRIAITARYPASQCLPGSEGARIEGIYATLDAIKNPWRNATMHTEVTYQPYEAAQILQCVNVFLTNLAAICDENGAPI